VKKFGLIEHNYIIERNKIAQITVKNGTEQEYYFTFDGHGSTRVLTDIAGAIVELYAFDAYGNAIGFDPSVALTEFLYSGEQFDSKIGQQYLRARYYGSTTGIFNRIDPFFGNLNDPQSLHKYLYTHADPINGIDPTGLFSATGMVGTIGVAMASAASTVTATIAAHPIISMLSLLGFASAGVVSGYTSESSGAWYEGFIPGWGSGKGLGASLAKGDVVMAITNGIFLGLDLLSFGGFSVLAKGSAKAAPILLKQMSEKTVHDLFVAIEKVTEMSKFRKRIIKAGFNADDIPKLITKIKKQYMDKGMLGFTQSSIPWVDNEIMAISETAMNRWTKMAHELTHLLDDISNPGILSTQLGQWNNWWKIANAEYKAFFVQYNNRVVAAGLSLIQTPANIAGGEFGSFMLREELYSLYCTMYGVYNWIFQNTGIMEYIYSE
jgi:RHS repeat-associated protein